MGPRWRRRTSAKRRPGPTPARCPGPCCATIIARYVIVGHSEQRQVYREDDGQVARKFSRALSSGLIPVSTLRERRSRSARPETPGRSSRGRTAVRSWSRAASRAYARRSSPTSRCGRSAPAVTRPRPRPSRSTPTAAAVAKRDRGARLPPILYGGSVKARTPRRCSRWPTSTAASSVARPGRGKSPWPSAGRLRLILATVIIAALNPFSPGEGGGEGIKKGNL